MISSENVSTPKYKEQILAERTKKIDTDSIDRKVNNHENSSIIMRRFQIGDFSAGYLENQYIGM